MSRQPMPENVQALEHEHGDVTEVLSADEKGSQILDVIPIAKVDSDDEPIVTRRELWSYYRTFSLSFSLQIIQEP